MRLLVTNTRAPQSYAVIRALRPHAETIVATVYGRNRLAARLSHAANSRLVDRRYRVPSPLEAWRAGGEDRAEEEAWVGALLEICEREGIDTIYPSWDPEVYLLSKHKARFEDRGILIPIPEFEVALQALDKGRTMRAAERIGFPIPRTLVGGEDLDIDRFVDEVGFPLVVKPRFGSGALGLEVVSSSRELRETLEQDPDRLLIQEFIRGGRKLSVNVVLDRKGDVKFTFHKRRLRHTRLHAKLSTASQSAPLPDFTAGIVDLLREIGWFGSATVEVLIDPRDGAPRLMEINSRFPRQLWNRTELGINEPLLCLRIARGEEVDPLPSIPPGVVFLNPVEDLQLLGFQLADLLAYKLRRSLPQRPRQDAFAPPMSFAETVRSFRATYALKGRRVLAPCVRYFLRDPLVSITWWMAFATWVFGERRRLGA